MTVAAQKNKIIYAGDGATKVWAITFPLADTILGSDLQLWLIDNLGNVTPITADYAINPATMQVTYPVAAAALAVGYSVGLLRVEPLTQGLALTDTGPYSAKTLEKTLDQIVMTLQQLQEQLDRCVKYPLNQVAASTDVNAFIAAVSAILLKTNNGTYDQLKAMAALSPSTQMWGWATNLGMRGQLMFYSGFTDIGDGGWFGPLAGG